MQLRLQADYAGLDQSVDADSSRPATAQRYDGWQRPGLPCHGRGSCYWLTLSGVHSLLAQNAVEAIGVLGTEKVYAPAIKAIGSLQTMAVEAQFFNEAEGFGRILDAYAAATEATNGLRAAIRAELGIACPSPEKS